MQHDSQPNSRLKAFMCTERWRNVVNENSQKGKYTNRKKRMTNKHKKTYEDIRRHTKTESLTHFCIKIKKEINK